MSEYELSRCEHGKTMVECPMCERIAQEEFKRALHYRRRKQTMQEAFEALNDALVALGREVLYALRLRKRSDDEAGDDA